MKFGIHNPSCVFGPDPTEAFEGVKAKAQWAENHGFVWFSVMDHMIQIGGVGAPDEPFMESWTVLSGLSAVTSSIRLATLATSVGYRNPAHLAKIAAGVDLISRGRLTLGIGAGYLETEYRQYGWGFLARRRCVSVRWRRPFASSWRCGRSAERPSTADIFTPRMPSSSRSRPRSRARR